MSSAEEIYGDVKDIKLNILLWNGTEKTAMLKRMRKSIGWVEPEEVEWKRKDSNVTKKRTEWDVYLGDGSSFTCEEQEHAEMLSYLVQINERLKRLERGKNET